VIRKKKSGRKQPRSEAAEKIRTGCMRKLALCAN